MIDRRRGIPITLSVVVIEVARRLGVVVHGVGMPGHFLVQAAALTTSGATRSTAARSSTVDGCRAPVRRRARGERAAHPRDLAPTPPRAILARMLANLEQGPLRRAARARRLRLHLAIPDVPLEEQVQLLRARARRSTRARDDGSRSRTGGVATSCGEARAARAVELNVMSPKCRCSRSAPCCSRMRCLPLHVFEPRYRVMMRHCLDGDREFGVVLIERGSEVGGGDVRFDVGTLARIVQATELPDGRLRGRVRRRARGLRVERWLPDDPFPLARDRSVRRNRRVGPDAYAARDAVRGRVRRCAASCGTNSTSASRPKSPRSPTTRRATCSSSPRSRRSGRSMRRPCSRRADGPRAARCSSELLGEPRAEESAPGCAESTGRRPGVRTPRWVTCSP